MTISKTEGKAREFQRQMLEDYLERVKAGLSFKRRLEAMYELYKLLGELQDAVFVDEVSEDDAKHIHLLCVDMCASIMEFDLDVSKNARR